MYFTAIHKMENWNSENLSLLIANDYQDPYEFITRLSAVLQVTRILSFLRSVFTKKIYIYTHLYY